MGKVSLDDLPEIRGVPTLTAAQMAEADRATIQEIGIPVRTLMENASRQIAAGTRAFLGEVAARRIIAIAGRGNNGGDALGAARVLRGWGADARVVLAGQAAELREAPAQQHGLFVRTGGIVAEANEENAAAVGETLAEADLVIDGLLGYSARGAPRGLLGELVRAANRSGAPILAVDLPSGLHPDTGEPLGVAIRAACTVTLALPKTGLLEPRSRALVGELLLADIGIPASVYDRFGIDAKGVFGAGDLVRILR